MCKFLARAFGLEPKRPIIPVIPAPPPVQAPVPAPSQADADAAAVAEIDKVNKMKGRASTVLTSGAGDTSAVSLKAPVATGMKTLLGA